MTNLQNKQKPKRNKTIKHSIQYLSATIIAQGIGVCKSIFMPILFAPTQMGIWNLMGVIIGYGANAQLGLLDGMNKLIPLLRGQKKFQEIEIVKNSVFWVNLSLGALAAILLVISSFFVSADYFFYLCLIAFIVFLQLIFFYQFSLLRANSLFGILSKGIVILSISSAVFVLSLAFLFYDRVVGALTGLAVANIVVVGYWFIRMKYRFPLQIDFSIIRRSFGIGIPLIIVGVLNIAFISIDRWLIAANLGITVLGYYALGIMVNNMISLIPGSVASTLYPKMLERFAVRKNPADSAKMLLGTFRLGGIVMLIVICAVSFGLPLLIKFFLPKYLSSVVIIKILVLGSFFYSLSTIAGTYLISIDRQRVLIFIQTALIGVSILSYSLALKLGCGISTVAVVTACVYSIFGISYIWSGVYLVKGQKYRETLRFMMGLIIPFVLMAILIIWAGLFMVTEATSGLYLQSSVLSFLLIIAVLLPTFWLLNRDSDLENLVRGELSLLRSTVLNIIYKNRKKK